MTEQEKAFGRKMIVGSLVTMLVLLCLAIVWQKLNEPMTPIVMRQGDHSIVQWGNRFYPFEYIAVDRIDGSDGFFRESVRVPGVGLFRIENGHMLQAVHNDINARSGYGWQPIHELPAEAKRVLLLGRLQVDAHLHPEKLRRA